ncbi:MAG TPA: hypothetical protein VFY85_01115 [Gemmatimonadaceae bacterium]|jgi:hypothetical protein|nr:hypothetical protein [Gemmatimonadaceae bacterium]
MRTILTPLLLPFAAWLSALQALSGSALTLDGSARLAAIAGVLGTLTVLVYRLGVWRSEMEHTKHDVAEEVKAHREESAVHFERVEQRLEAIDHLVSAAGEYRLRANRWQARTERRLERMERLILGEGTR